MIATKLEDTIPIAIGKHYMSKINLCNFEPWCHFGRLSASLGGEKKKVSCVLLKSLETYSSKAFCSYFKYFSGQQ